MESTSKCQNCGMKPISEFDIWDTGKKIGKPKTRCNKCSKKKNKKILGEREIFFTESSIRPDANKVS